MVKHVGIVACSAEGAALCYRTFCAEAAAAMGEHRHPEVSIHTHCLADYMVQVRAGNWEAVAELMLSSTRKLAGIGAQIVVCPDNTIHQAYNLVVEQSPIPWLHIAEVVAEEAVRTQCKHLAITGTRYLMEGPVYSEVLKRWDIATQTPDADDRDWIDRTIFNELVNGRFTEEARSAFNAIAQRMQGRGCDAVVLGCTEIPLLVDPNACPLPTLDSTRLLARAALRAALGLSAGNATGSAQGQAPGRL